MLKTMLRGLKEEIETTEANKQEPNEMKINGKDSATYRKNAGFYVQCNHFPNAVHHPNLISEVILHPSHIYENEIEYKFGICERAIN